MKKRMLLVLLILLVSAGYAVMPRMVESSVPTAYYITPSRKTYRNVVNCTGIIQSEDVRQVSAQSAFVAQEVCVEIGDVVNAGDTLLRIDQEKTQQIAHSLSLLQGLSDNQGTQGQELPESIDWAALAASYGLSTAVQGELALDAGMIEGFLSDNAILSGETTTVLSDPGDAEIRSPIAGVVTAVDIQPGLPAAAGKAVLTIADNRRHRVLASIREEDVGRVQVGDTAKIRGVGFSGTTYDGTVTKIYPTARKAISGTGTETVVDAEITLHGPDEQLRPGFTAKVEIQSEDDLSLITVPYEAIRQDENNNEYVYLYEDGKLKMQVVVTGQEMTNEVEILDGVTATSIVVYNPSSGIGEGDMIHIVGRANVD